MRENEYQHRLKEKILDIFPDAIVLKNDSGWLQGICDLTILNGDRWASLEVKKSATEKHQPNQDYYVEKMNGMSYSAFIFPENEEEFLSELQRALQPRRKTRVPKS